MPKTQTKTQNPFAALAQAKKPAAKASEIPVIVAPQSLHREIADMVAAIAAAKDAESKMDAAKALISPFAKQARVEASQSKGEAISSVRLVTGGDDPKGVTVTEKCAYSAIDPQHKPDLKKAFGKDMETMFASTLTITVKKGADHNALAALLGDRIGEFFDIVETTKPTEKFYEAMSLDEEFRAKAEPFIGSVIRPYEPSITPYKC